MGSAGTRNRAWLWVVGLALIAGVGAYAMWVAAPWCGSGDGETRSASAIANDTDILLEMRVSHVEVDRADICSIFVTASGSATDLVAPSGVSVPPVLEIGFFAARRADRSALRDGSVLLVGFADTMSSEAVTSVGVVVNEDRVNWIAPTSGWEELPPSLAEWSALVTS